MPPAILAAPVLAPRNEWTAVGTTNVFGIVAVRLRRARLTNPARLASPGVASSCAWELDCDMYNGEVRARTLSVHLVSVLMPRYRSIQCPDWIVGEHGYLPGQHLRTFSRWPPALCHYDTVWAAPSSQILRRCTDTSRGGEQ